MAQVQTSRDVSVPVRVAYDQWTQFEDFPRFMEGVEEVRQLDDTHLHWVANIGGVRREWDAAITEQIPDQRIAWRSTDGADNAGAVTFHRLGEGETRVMLQLDFQPDGVVERAADLLGVVERRAAGDLERFAEFVSERGRATGSWRGSVPQDPTS